MKRRMSAMLGAAAAAWLCAAPATAAVSCAKWNTWAFFERASAADVSRCLRAGADVNPRIKGSRRTPLHGAAEQNKNPAVVDALLKGGANVNARIKGSRRTPLHFAAATNKTAVVGALLKAGADAGARDRIGRTPFDFAKKNSKLKGTDAYWRLNDERFK